jgi:hypothetical protein
VHTPNARLKRGSFIITWPHPPSVESRADIAKAIPSASGSLLPGAGIRWTCNGNLGISFAPPEEINPYESRSLQKIVEDLFSGHIKAALSSHSTFANFRVVPDSPWEELVVHGIRPAVANFDDISAALGASADLILVKNLIKANHRPDAVRSVKIALPLGNPLSKCLLADGLNISSFSCRVSKYWPRKSTPRQGPPPSQ